MLSIRIFTVVAETTEGAFIEGSYMDQSAAKQRLEEITDPNGDVAYAKSEASIHETTLWLPEVLCLIMSQDYADGRKDAVPEKICFDDKTALKEIKKMLGLKIGTGKSSRYQKHELSYRKIPLCTQTK